jgi:pimeloyl-ACP methyl ester carboxylesterase
MRQSPSRDPWHPPDHPDLFRVADLLVSRIPGAKRIDVPGAGHVVHVERPAEFNRVLLGFLDEVSAGSARSRSAPHSR